jgi:zinc/manganese transport system substrate-binding protein
MSVKFWLSLLVLVLPFRAAAEVSVFACEPEWKALAETVGGASVSVFSATTARQDPHHIQARPSLIAKLRRADLLICTGADLEAGWLPLLIRRARNPKVLAGRPGHLMAAQYVELLEVPDRLDRSEGDVHADGNPHIHLNPENLLRVAEVLTERLGRIDPDNGESYRSRLADFEKRWTQAIGDWKNDAHSLAGHAVIVHHREWIYLLDWLGMKRMATLEPKPGVPPSAGHLSELKATLEQQSALAIIRSPINDKRPSEWLSARSGVPALILPYTVDGTDDAKDLFKLYETSISRLTALTK